ncbi:MAG: response regulator, partial [Caldilineaceae bacterium]|nr:response regulator [Caldilineaceae bacterium]
MNKIRVLLVDDHMVVRVGLTALINAEPDMEVVGEASNGAEGVDATVEQRPDVVVMDISMPVMDGLEA